MQPDSAKVLEDIREAGQTILEVTSGKVVANQLSNLMQETEALLAATRREQ
jgi:hypothetical protein